jgi:putative transposase
LVEVNASVWQLKSVKTGHDLPPRTDPRNELGSKQKETGQMARKRYTSEDIIQKLREAEVLLSQGQTVQQAARTLEISEQTYCRWRRQYGGKDKSQARRMKELEQENARLRQAVADLTLDKAILKEALSKK